MRNKSRKLVGHVTVVRMAIGLLFVVCPFCPLMAQDDADLEEVKALTEKLKPLPASSSIYDDAPDAYEKFVEDYERFKIHMGFPKADVKVFGRYRGDIFPNMSARKNGGVHSAFPCGLQIEAPDACMFVLQCDRDRPWWEYSSTDPGGDDVMLVYLLLDHMRDPDNPQRLQKGFRERDCVTVRKDRNLLAACGADSITVVRFPKREEIGARGLKLPDYPYCYGAVLCKAGKYGDLSTLLFLKSEKSLNKYLKYLCKHAKFVEK